MTIDDRAWEGGEPKDFSASGNTFENQTVALRPATDKERAQMIRSSRWGSDGSLTFSKVPDGGSAL